MVRRYKRFLADVRLESGTVITAFTPNTGSMKTCSDTGSPVMLSHEIKPGRRTEYTLEMVQVGGTWVGVNTILANRLAAALVDADLTGVRELAGFRVKKREFVHGDSRLDLLLERNDSLCLAEVKNVTLVDRETALFPDAVSTRGRKHLNNLAGAISEGYLTCMLYMVQRSDCNCFAPALDIDPLYADAFYMAMDAGVKMIPCRLKVMPEGIYRVDRTPMKVMADGF